MPVPETPIACKLHVFSPDERARHAVLRHKLGLSVTEAKELPDGMGFLFRPGSVTLTEVEAWVDGERKCCPFFDFIICEERESRGIALELRGSSGVKEFAQREFAGWLGK